MMIHEKPHDPWLLAAWPGMGGVAVSAAYYLMAKLGMHLLVELPAAGFFEPSHVDVKDGLVIRRRLPRSRLFLWNDPEKRHDLILFIGEAQPPTRGGDFCRRVIEHATSLGVSRVFTFAAMATQMRPVDRSRVFCAAIDRETLTAFRKHGAQVMENGAISGLNGVLLGTAAAAGLPGGCLLGEIPQVFSQIPFPKAALAVLDCFNALSGIETDLSEIRRHADAVERTLEDFLSRMEQAVKESETRSGLETEHENGAARRGETDRRHLEKLFEKARKDRSRAYELKQELDRLGLFPDYEDRFLDLFKEP
jgi:uncharacterized protein